MLSIRRVLFPTDYSACAERAFTHAAYLADRYGAELHVLHVAEPAEGADGGFADAGVADFRITPEDIAADLHLPLPERADRPADEPLALVEVEETGSDPASAILDYAEEHDIDLIVMGTHGRRGLRHMMMGSVAEEVVRLAPCPVFTVRTLDEGIASVWTIGHVLAPVDLSDRSYVAARHAAALAAAYDAELDLVYVLDVSASAGSAANLEAVRQRSDAELMALAETLEAEFPALRGRVSTHLRVGQPVRDLLDVAAETGTDLLVLGSHGRTGVRRFLMGSVASQLIRLAPSPVFTLKSFGRPLLDEERSRTEDRLATT